MTSLGRMLIAAGCLLILVGLVLVVAGRFSLPFGRLPGDISFRGRNWQVFIPLGTSIVISIVLSLVLYLLSRLRR
jgi:uncharacterized membrane protein